jgi:hypothetical protein
MREGGELMGRGHQNPETAAKLVSRRRKKEADIPFDAAFLVIKFDVINRAECKVRMETVVKAGTHIELGMQKLGERAEGWRLVREPLLSEIPSDPKIDFGLTTETVREMSANAEALGVLRSVLGFPTE